MSLRRLWLLPVTIAALVAGLVLAVRLGNRYGVLGTIRFADAVRSTWVRRLLQPGRGAAPTELDAIGDAEDPRVAIARVSAVYIAALLDGDASAYASTYLEEALAVPGNGPIVRGRAAIQEAMADTFAAVRLVEAEMSSVDFRLTGETALETGHYRYLVAKSADAPAHALAGRYAIVWKRYRNEWRIALDTSQLGVAP